MRTQTKVSKGFQISVPSRIRKVMGIEPGDLFIWEKRGDKIIVKVEKKPSLQDIVDLGRADVTTDAVDLKKKAQRGLL